MSVESYLTRELDIRFIDARSIVNEAKVSLGIVGYPLKDQEKLLKQEAIKIYGGHNVDVQTHMRRLKGDLDAVKIPAGSPPSHSIVLDASSNESSYDSFGEEGTSCKQSHRRFSMWPIRKK
jgi:hypothetical protein